MIAVEEFSKKLLELKLDTAIGVPDSTFKGLISYFSTQNVFHHIIAANECEAMGIAAGYFLGQHKPAVVYMQNSGFCKTLNPHTSLLSTDVYALPALMLVGWRGEPGKKDEPQHKMMGRILLPLIDTMEIDYRILDEMDWPAQLEEAREKMMKEKRPFILVIKKGLFGSFEIPPHSSPWSMTREEALNIIANHTPPNAVFISTTGKTSRELFEIREQRQQDHGSDFYTVGSMGCASSIAFGLGLAPSERPIFILDGDGAALMQLGTMATLGHYKNPRLKHVIFDNSAHESTGGQPTVSPSVDFLEIARACGYERLLAAGNREELEEAMKKLEDNDALSLLVIKIKKGSRPDLGRPTTTPQENRNAFMHFFAN